MKNTPSDNTQLKWWFSDANKNTSVIQRLKKWKILLHTCSTIGGSFRIRICSLSLSVHWVILQIHGDSVQGRILHGNSPSELIQRFTETIGRLPELPEWIISGAVVGMQGGTDSVRQVCEKLQAHNTPVSALWLQVMHASTLKHSETHPNTFQPFQNFWHQKILICFYSKIPKFRVWFLYLLGFIFISNMKLVMLHTYKFLCMSSHCMPFVP